MDWIRLAAESVGIDFKSPDAVEKLTDHFRSSAAKALANPIRLYGHRTENMFAYVAHALGRTLIVKREESGLILTDSGQLKCPDLRIKLRTDEEFLVEVKNFCMKSLFSVFRVKANYLDMLTTYAQMFDVQLYIAIYWQGVNTWTLNVPADFSGDHARKELAYTTAYARSHMSLLGDAEIATVPPLELYLGVKEPSLPKEGKVEFTVASSSLLCAGQEIVDENERNLAWYLMHYGNWTEGSQVPYFDSGGRVFAVGLRIEPELPEDAEQGFHIIGSLSGMASNLFKLRTSKDSAVIRLDPGCDPVKLAAQIPDRYSGEVLKLWRFVLQPNPEFGGT